MCQKERNMIKKESTKPKGFKNTPHLKSTTYQKSVKDDHESSNETSEESSNNSLILPFICAISVILLSLITFWPKHSTDVTIKLDTKQPVYTMSKKIDKDSDTTTLTFTYGKEHPETMVLVKDDDAVYIGDDSSDEGDFEAYYIESTTDKQFKSMENAMVNVNVSKIQDNSTGSVHFKFNPGSNGDQKKDDEDLFATPKNVHREIYLKIK